MSPKPSQAPRASSFRRQFLHPLVLASLVSWVHAQTADTNKAIPPGPTSSDTVIMSPFEVTTSSDKGYKATNAVSGTRLDSKIKDIPMPLEVITGEFIKDTGAMTLRGALQYSAGIQLQSQNDYLGNGLAAYQNPGGVNNPEQQTANKTDTSIVIRGFTTDNALRDGFRRKVTTDSVNISRIEVVRGPAALLYGIGNFGGVVNYLVKTPTYGKAEQMVDFNLGSYGLKRATFEVNQPLGSGDLGNKLAMRLTGSFQENGDYTDYYKVKKWSIAPIISYRPFKGTEITIDAEYGRNSANGTGFQSLRTRADRVNNAGGQEHAGFIAFPGISLRTMRWSGGETYQKSYQGNLEVKLTQHIFEGLDLLVGYNHSSVTFNGRDINANLAQNIGPVGLWSTVYPVGLAGDRGDTDANWTSAPQTHAIVAYEWKDTLDGTRADQVRTELNYRKTLFEGRRWLSFENNILVGLGTERDKQASQYYGLDGQNTVWNYKSANDPLPFRYEFQGDGSPSLPEKLRNMKQSTARERGYYAIYQGKFLNGMITLLGGARRDKNGVDTNTVNYKYADGSIDTGSSSHATAPEKSYNTSQVGVSFAPVKWISFYAMRSQGINPNFSGDKDLTGKPMDAVTATDKEFGVKIDLWGGRISGTISHYEINRSGQPNHQFWWAPTTGVHNFDPAKPVVYNVTRLNPDAATKYSYKDNTGAVVPLIDYNNNYAYWGSLANRTTVPAGAAGLTATPEGLQSYAGDPLNGQRDAVVNTWNAAKAAGAVKYYDKNGNAVSEAAFTSLISNGDPSSGYTMITASTPEGAAYMDAIYQYSRAAGIAHPGSDNWPGWFFNSAPAGTGYNSAQQDSNSGTGAGFAAAESDRNEGWDGQLIFTPNDDLQLLFSFSKNNHTILSLGQFPTYPYQDKDRWAVWMFPNGQWGLSSYYDKNEQYTNEADTSTFSFKGLIYPGAQGMDYPKWSWSAFVNYRLSKLGLKNMRIGGGVIHTGPQEYESGFTHGGDAFKDDSGHPIILETESRWTVNLFARYEFDVSKHEAYVQLNVDNVLDDRHQYGLLYAPGRSFNFGFGAKF
ncbi:MAG TPA: TonB-dependent receptor [Opitutaceae bacterium]|nr:TonB-dependent receptor [Opitutaceae bacterium]